MTRTWNASAKNLSVTITPRSKVGKEGASRSTPRAFPLNTHFKHEWFNNIGCLFGIDYGSRAVGLVAVQGGALLKARPLAFGLVKGKEGYSPSLRLYRITYEVLFVYFSHCLCVFLCKGMNYF